MQVSTVLFGASAIRAVGAFGAAAPCISFRLSVFRTFAPALEVQRRLARVRSTHHPNGTALLLSDGSIWLNQQRMIYPSKVSNASIYLR
jgi:hypothetical protein